MAEKQVSRGSSSHVDQISGANDRIRRVAIIGVHGVAHHDPGATANAMADLLLSLPPFDPTAASRKCEDRPTKLFNSFSSLPIQIPLEPVCIDEASRVQALQETRVHREMRFLQEESAEFARALAQEKKSPQEGDVEDEVGLKYTRRLLQNYQGGADGNVYITTRLDGRRSASARQPATDVHIYEMFWADLARPTNSLVSFFLAVFQLVLHLPSLSRVAIDTQPNANKLWQTLQFAQRYASRMLQIVIPLLKVVLLIALFSAAANIREVQKLGVVSALLVALSVAAAGLVLMEKLRRPVFGGRLSWIVVSFLPASLAGGVTFILVRDNQWNQGVVLGVVAWLLGALLLSYVLSAYQDVQAGILYTGWASYIAFLTMFWIYAVLWRSLGLASLWTAQWLFVILRFSWLLLTGFAIAAFVLGEVAWRTQSSTAERAQARAAVRTSRLALALPSFLFVFITGFIWAGLFSVAKRIENPYFKPAILSVAPGLKRLDDVTRVDLFPHLPVADVTCSEHILEGRPCTEFATLLRPCAEGWPCDYLEGVLTWSLGYGMLVAVLVTASALLLLVWWALPSVLTERVPVRKKIPAGTIRTEPPRSSTNHESKWLGGWISRGLDSTSLLAYLSWIAIFLVPVVFLFTAHWRYPFEMSSKMAVEKTIAIAASTALLAALVRYSSPVLRCILDVDTYLRAGPHAATPRARIFERYASLLRHVAQYRDPDGRPYDAVVIVAHSLGSLISADLLRLLHSQRNDPRLELLGFGPSATSSRIPIRLFTMGSPLRQLLNRFFPYLYGWVRTSPDNGLNPLPAPSATPTAIPPSTLPSPAGLGIVLWWNAYRSGDYVGRSLWLEEWYQRTTTGSGIYPQPITTAGTGNWLEFCIGAGAHTHYWDDTAPDVAERLNQLINPVP